MLFFTLNRHLAKFGKTNRKIILFTTAILKVRFASGNFVLQQFG